MVGDRFTWAISKNIFKKLKGNFVSKFFGFPPPPPSTGNNPGGTQLPKL
jgi:hypothetical protein